MNNIITEKNKKRYLPHDINKRKEFFAARDAFMKMVKNPECVSVEAFREAAAQLRAVSNSLANLALIELEERLSAFRGK